MIKHLMVSFIKRISRCAVVARHVAEQNKATLSAKRGAVFALTQGVPHPHSWKSSVRGAVSSVSFQVVLILVILVMPLNILYISAAYRATHALETQALNNMKGFVSIYKEEIENRTVSADSYMKNTIDGNDLFLKMSTAEDYNAYNMAKYKLAQEMIEEIKNGTGGDYYFIYDESDSAPAIILKSYPETLEYGAAVKSFLAVHAEDYFSSSWQYVQIESREFLIRSDYSSGIYIGSLIVLDDYRDSISLYLDYDDSIVRFSPDSEGQEEIPSGYLGFCSAIAGTDTVLTAAAPVSEIYRGLSFFQRNSLSIAMIYLLLIPLLILVMHLILLNPLRLLEQAILKIRKGDEGYRIPEGYLHRYAKEFRRIMESFNQMADSIHSLTIKNYEVALEKEQIELDNLQLTIRPHFLQNTFGVLYALCQMGKYDQLGPSILYLSDYFRYTYAGVRHLATFSSELAIIRQYVQLARVQHPGGFEITYEVQGDGADVLIPPLLIHNFIENIMSHALIRGTCVHILLKLDLYEEKRQAVFHIRDDGSGIDSSFLEDINNGRPIHSQGKTHVGLYNSWQRLDKTYHGLAGMHVGSGLGEGTVVRVWVPLAQSEEELLGRDGNDTSDCK